MVHYCAVCGVELPWRHARVIKFGKLGDDGHPVLPLDVLNVCWACREEVREDNRRLTMPRLAE